MSKIDYKEIFTLNNILYFVAVGTAFFIAWKTVGVIQQNYALQKKVDGLRDKIAVLELENEKLTFNNEYYRTDSYLDYAAREKFNKKAPGERVIYVSRYKSPSGATTETPRDTKPENKPTYRYNLDQWLYFLFGRKPS